MHSHPSLTTQPRPMVITTRLGLAWLARCVLLQTCVILVTTISWPITRELASLAAGTFHGGPGLYWETSASAEWHIHLLQGRSGKREGRSVVHSEVNKYWTKNLAGSSDVPCIQSQKYHPTPKFLVSRRSQPFLGP